MFRFFTKRREEAERKAFDKAWDLNIEISIKLNEVSLDLIEAAISGKEDSSFITRTNSALTLSPTGVAHLLDHLPLSITSLLREQTNEVISMTSFLAETATKNADRTNNYIPESPVIDFPTLSLLLYRTVGKEMKRRFGVDPSI